MPIFSLPNDYGIGSFGKEGYEFIDFLERSNIKVWQILPLVQTGYGNSPYSSVSSKSFNPYFISLEELREQNLLRKDEIESVKTQDKYIDYGKLYQTRFPLLRKAFSRFDKGNADFIKFIKKGEFLDYALFSAIKIKTGYKPFYEWEQGLKTRKKESLDAFYKENKEEVLFWAFLEYEAEREWKSLKKYANLKGIKILGDMPLYMALDSVDVWKNPELFKLDEDFKPIKVAGVPPDYFCNKGQLWGNPVYDYSEHIKDGFSWWIERIKSALKIYDYVRIDHFRGLNRYYEVDYGREDATVGEWVEVPDKELFDAVKSKVSGNKIIAEDLGIIDDKVRDLLAYTGFPGMKILSFAFNGESDNLYLPERIEENAVCYTGTHDNDTLSGLIDNFSEWDYNNLITGVKKSCESFNVPFNEEKESLIDCIIELGFLSKAYLFILPMADVLKKNTDYRINEPGTVKEQNWAIKFRKEDFRKETSEYLRKLNLKYKR